MKTLFLIGILSLKLSFATTNNCKAQFELSPLNLLLIHLKDYKNPAGMKNFINNFYNGDSKKALREVSELYGEEVFHIMGWTGEPSPLDHLQGLPEKYKTEKGFKDFIKEHYQGDEKKALQAVINRWGKEALDQLQWPNRI